MSANHLNEFAHGATLVFGGSGGIGSAICRRLAEAGSNVALSFRNNTEVAKSVVADIEAAGQAGWAQKVDITCASEVKSFADAAAERFGGIHSVVYASGPHFGMQYLSQTSPEEWANVINTDVNGCFNVVWATVPHLKARPESSFVAIVTSAVDRAPPRDVMSAAPKAAIRMMLQGLAREEGRFGLRVNCVGPGYVQAGISDPDAMGFSQEYVGKIASAIPLRKEPGTADDVANAVCFLLSNEARYITGETISVAGGLQIT